MILLSETVAPFCSSGAALTISWVRLPTMNSGLGAAAGPWATAFLDLLAELAFVCRSSSQPTAVSSRVAVARQNAAGREVVLNRRRMKILRVRRRLRDGA